MTDVAAHWKDLTEGLVGGAVDALALHHRAEESLRSWFGSVARRIGG